ncbi:hypothetical protein [Parvularcula dongshanensis]|uniref:UDP-N-acetyl-alpha-D-muramoyl-L-alanyl-L-glutamate epimerase n=1 Tax=Parvularcula dongshanensis TaxID=1173995 RepID=A0A840I273_9PROT|nr:hypothetical protein [Parvularcula dongshanensis]
MPNSLPRTENFAFADWRIEDGTAVFAFECGRFGRFEERVWFPDTPMPADPGEALSRLLTLLHVALGVSTYKAAAAKRITFPALGPAGRGMARRLYADGLAEFFVRAGLDFPPDTEMKFAPAPPALAPAPPAEGPALVAFGGGKDSHVARAIVQAAGEDVHLAAVILSDAVGNAIQATAPAPVTLLHRRLDPKLSALESAFNGHVPITAINMLVLTVYAMLTGHGAVVFANERSADEPTMRLGRIEANHQDSKSSRFEALLDTAVAEAAPGAPLPFSILRPYSEVWIGETFATLKEAFPRFTSCNRNFRLAGDASARWCGACAKCAFTSLILGPHLTPEETETAFGGVFLDRPALQPYYEQLLGLTDIKPWDCVGTIEESRATLWTLSTTEWGRARLATRSFLPRVLAQESEASLEQAWARARTPLPDVTSVPERYRRAAERL